MGDGGECVHGGEGDVEALGGGVRDGTSRSRCGRWYNVYSEALGIQFAVDGYDEWGSSAILGDSIQRENVRRDTSILQNGEIHSGWHIIWRGKGRWNLLDIQIET